MARNITTQDVSWFLDLFRKDQLDLEPPYQRRSVWSNKDKQFFIDTVMNNYPAPPVFLYKSLDEDGRATYHVVDGKQRLSTIIDFVQGKMRIPDNFTEETLRKKRWNDLSREDKERLWNYTISVEMIPEVSNNYIRTIFDRINRNSRNLKPQEMRHAKYEGWFLNRVENESEQPIWREFGISTPARVKRMANVQFVSELFGVLLSRKIAGFDQDALDDMYAAYDEIEFMEGFSEDDFNAELERVKSYIGRIFLLEDSVRPFFKVQLHLYSLWAFVALEDQNLVPAEEFAPVYANFLAKIAGDENPFPNDSPEGLYIRASQGAMTDLPQRLDRHRALVDLLQRVP